MVHRRRVTPSIWADLVCTWLSGWRLAAVVAVLVSIWILGRCLLPGVMNADYSNSGDTYRHLIVWSTAKRAVWNGTLPYWIPELATGFPLWASFQFGLCSPGFLLFVLLPVETAHAASLALHMVLAAVGMYLLCRRLRTRHTGALTGAFCFAFSSFFVGQFACGHIFLVWPLAWTPWMLWALDRAIVRPSGRKIAGAALLLALALTSGHAQMAVYIGGLFVLWVLVRGASELRRRSGMRRSAANGRPAISSSGAVLDLWRRVVLVPLCIGLLGLLLSAWQWLPFVDLLANVGGTKTNLRFQELSSMPPEGLWSYLLPHVYGVNPGRISENPHYERFDYFYGGHEWLCFSSSLVLWLALVGIGGRERWWCIALSVTALAGLVLVLGTSTPLYEQIIRVVPLLGMGRTPGRAAMITLLAISLLAAYGCRVLEWRIRRRRSLASAYVAGALIFALAGAGAIHFTSIAEASGFPTNDYLAVVLFSVLAALIPLGVVLAVMKWCRMRRKVSVWRWSVVVVLAVSSAVVEGRRIEPISTESLYAPPPALFAGRTPWEFRIAEGRVFPEDPTHGLYANAPVHGFHMTGPIIVTILDRLDYRLFTLNFDERRLSISNAEFIHFATSAVAVRPLKQQESHWEKAPLPPLPRAKLYWNTRIVESLNESLLLIDSGELPIDDTLLLHRSPESAPTLQPDRPAETADLDGSVQVESYRPGRIRLQVNNPREGWLYLAEKYAAGWKAWVDGRPVPIERAFVTFESLQVPAGRHRVELRYRPVSLVVGEIGSILGAWACLVAYRRRKRNADGNLPEGSPTRSDRR